MNKMGNKLREDELHALIADADVDGNGTIDYEEFVAATVNLNKLEKEEHCMQVNPQFNHYYFVVIGLLYKASPRLPATPAQAKALPREGASALVSSVQSCCRLTCCRLGTNKHSQSSTLLHQRV
jgi:hypothetical protein